MVHGQTPESMGRDQSFPVSIEVQLLAGKTRPHRQRLLPRHPHRARWQALHDPLHERRQEDVSRSANGSPSKSKSTATNSSATRSTAKPCIEYSGSQLDEKDADAKRLLEAGASKEITGGTISLQSESHPVEFRNVELKELPE